MTAKYWGAYNYVRVKCLTTIAQGKQGKTDLIYKMWRQFMSIANCRARVSKFRPPDKFILLLIFVQKLRMFYTFWKRVGRRRYKTMYLLFGSLQKELLRTAWSKSFSWYNRFLAKMSFHNVRVQVHCQIQMFTGTPGLYLINTILARHSKWWRWKMSPDFGKCPFGVEVRGQTCLWLSTALKQNYKIYI